MPAATHWIVTGNYTDSGHVAWRRADGTWSTNLQDAGLVDSEDRATAIAGQANTSEQREIADPYVIPVRFDDGTIDPLTARERIRANGPTVPTLTRPAHRISR